ncbi:MAG: DNA gyrase/topoisomerase IV subunit A [Rikenellaceae bacterium]|jgi:topoisomerase-4 subunit A|nr:DNA gyrase/topoisomerase IV subunit A [Rikenellaceae bacterium]
MNDEIIEPETLEPENASLVQEEESVGFDPETDEAMEADAEEVGVVPGRRTANSKYARLTDDTSMGRHKLTGMYMDWFLDYASYVILERAVPHLGDGLKPVQRRILHAMKRMDDGRYNKVANIIGNTMQFHPHGDASIGDALVQLGQKELLVDCQGNWGNILTGDGAAAPRYIEARLSKFALDVVFNPKTTEWMLSYDGRNQEPVTLPVKFPLLLAQGVEGIAVGLASKILPHNFFELIDSAIAHLKDEPFTLYPDFPTGGLIDCSRYNDGIRGGAVKVRARIEKIDRKTLSITEIPYGRTTASVIESIVKANDRGKIKIRRVDDNTAAAVEIQIQLAPDVSSDKTIDALYAFTDCEVSISPNACVIYADKPHFIGVSEILRRSVDHTKDLLRQELEIRLAELAEDWHMSSLEKIFIEHRIYSLIEECTTKEAVYETIDRGLDPFKKLLRRAVTLEDIVKLTEIKIMRISRFDAFKADEHIRSVEEEMKRTRGNLEKLVEYAIAYYTRIRDRHGKGRERKTELRGFDTIEAAKVVVANAKLYVNREEGFFGMGNQMKKDEFVCDCSDIDDIIVFTKDGRYIITKRSDKAFFDRNIHYIGVFKRNDDRTIYNVVYRDGRNGGIYMKRCAIMGITRDREYDMTKGTLRSEILYMSVNPNGEAEVLKVYFKPRPKLKKLIVDLDFSELAIKGRQSQGNLFSRYGIHKIVLKEKGASTLGGQNIWYDEDIRRLNADGRGGLLGEFSGNDRLIVITSRGGYYTTGFDVGQHFPGDTMIVERYEPQKVYSVTYYDAEQQYHYVKRFRAEAADRMQNFIDENPNSYLIEINSDDYPQLLVAFAGEHGVRPPEAIDVEAFIGVKSHRAKGKRVTNHAVESLKFIAPLDKSPSPSEEGVSGIIGNEEIASADKAAATSAAVVSVPAPEPKVLHEVEFEIDPASRKPARQPKNVPAKEPAVASATSPAPTTTSASFPAPVSETLPPPADEGPDGQMALF